MVRFAVLWVVHLVRFFFFLTLLSLFFSGRNSEMILDSRFIKEIKSSFKLYILCLWLMWISKFCRNALSSENKIQQSSKQLHSRCSI